MVEEGDRFVNKMKNLQGTPLEAKKIFMSVTLRVIIKSAFGGDFEPTYMEVTLS